VTRAAGLPARQRGVALLVALLVVALATVLIAGLLDRGELSAARTRNQLRTSQAEAYAQGMEAYAARVLQQDLNNGNTDTNHDVWAIPLPPTPVQGGEIAATMSDLNGRFNLNNLSPLNNGNNQQWDIVFQRLLLALKLDPNIDGAVKDWLSQSGSAGGDGFYLGQPVPYRASHNLFFHISELRLLRGVSGEVYAQLAPHVAALPPGTRINLNTATVPVLMTLADGVTQQAAAAIWQQGQANFSSVSDLASLAPGMAAICPVCYDVRSNYFRARGEIVIDGLTFTFYSVLQRVDQGADAGVHVIQRSRGSDE